jgi:CRISPR-associated protein Csb1
MEEALLAAAETGRIPLPRLVVDFPGAGLNSVGAISSLDAPHRIFDAILRDSEFDGQRFGDSNLGKALKQATAKDASAILQASPTSLLFGVWNSTGEGGGLGAKFARAIVSEIIGVDVPVEEVTDRRTGEIALRTAGRRTGSRIDPLGVLRSVEVFKDKSGWDVDKSKLGKDAKLVRPSEINHGNIVPSVDMLGVTCDHALQTLVITLAGFRRLRFGGSAERDDAARTYLAALGLVAALEADRQGHALRSRCDLVCDGLAPLELIGFDGRVREIALDVDAAVALFKQAQEVAGSAGFHLNAEPVVLKPQGKLVAIVEKSQAKALSDEAEVDG